MRDALGAVQSVLVLGGNSEIALATASALVADRCRRVVLAVRDPATAEAGATQLRRPGVTVEIVAFDAEAPDTHVEVIDGVFAGEGDIDLVLVAFGVLGDQADFDAHPEAAARAVQVNFVGAVSACLATAACFRTQGHGTLVVLSSVAAERARASNYVYGASKAGLDAFAQGLGDALIGSGARVMVVRPGFVHSRMTRGMAPQPFATNPEAVAAAITRGLARSDEIVWVPGLLRWLFVVMRHLPRRVWRVVSAR